MLTSEQREALLRLRSYQWPDEQEATDAALDTIDEQAQELALLRRMEPGFAQDDASDNAFDAWQEWRERFGKEAKNG